MIKEYQATVQVLVRLVREDKIKMEDIKALEIRAEVEKILDDDKRKVF